MRVIKLLSGPVMILLVYLAGYWTGQQRNHFTFNFNQCEAGKPMETENYQPWI